jgi:hypothetical protein
MPSTESPDSYGRACPATPPGFGLDDAALLGEYVVDRVATDHPAHRRLRRVAQHRSWVGDAVARLEGVLDPVLHHERKMHDVGVTGLHRRFQLLFFGGLGGAGDVAELLAVDRGDVKSVVSIGGGRCQRRPGCDTVWTYLPKRRITAA